MGFEAAVRDDCTFLSKAFDVLGFLREIAQRNEKWEVCIAVSSGAKHAIELPLHIFPDAIAPWADHHAAAHIRSLSQFRCTNHLLIPFREIFLAPRGNRGFSR